MTTPNADPTDERHGRGPLDARMKSSIAFVGASGVALGAVAAVFEGPAAAGAVVIGAALATANLWVLARVVAGLLPPEPADGESHPASPPDPRESRAWASLATIKTVGLLLVAWMILRYRVAAPLPLLVGFGALPIGIAIAAVVSDRRRHPKKGL
ncbi:MAG: hypothetical protein ACRENE_24755 [Polyangiaceae bacterium]